jgi:hypothetical protein
MVRLRGDASTGQRFAAMAGAQGIESTTTAANDLTGVIKLNDSLNSVPDGEPYT